MAKRYLEVRESKSLSMYDFDGSLDSVAMFVNDLKREYGEAAILDFSQSYDDVDVTVSWYRQETDIERDKRLAKARKARGAAKIKTAATEEAERAELARLTEKYS
jgi:hypothetical protein